MATPPGGRKTSEIVAQRLRAQIVSGELRPGDRLPPEAELLAELGVSRPTLREALRLLESEGLARVQRGNTGGTLIAAPDQGVLARYSSVNLAMAGASLEQVYAARDVLELEAVRLAAASRDRATCDALEAAIAEEAACGDDVLAYGAVHDRFHTTLLMGCGNPVLELLWHTLDEVVDRHQARFTRDRNADARVVAAGLKATRDGHVAHSRLVPLLRAGRSVDAERAWAIHLRAARDLLLMTEPGRLVDLLD